MNSLEWTLQFVDRMSGPGRNAAAAFEHLTDAQLDSMAAAKRLESMQQRTGAALREAAAGTRKLTAEDIELASATRRASREFEANGGALSAAQRASQTSMTGSLLQASFWQGLARGIFNASRAIVSSVIGIAETAGQAVFSLGQSAFAAATWGEDTKSSLEVLGGSIGTGEAEFARLRETTVSLGLSVRDSIDAYKGLRAQKFGAQEAETMIKLGADLQTVVGSSDEAIANFYRATAQIKAKGKLSAEEMMQIAEGVGIGQGAIFEQLSKALGKSTDEIRKMQEGGKISADVGIAAIQAAALEMVGASDAGQATAREVGTTLRGMMRLAKSGSEDWILSMGERLLPTFNRLATKAGEAFGELQKSGKIDAATNAIGASFEALLGGVESAIPDIQTLLGNMLDWVASGRLEDMATSVGEAFASVASSLEKAWPRIEQLLDSGAEGVTGSLTDMAAGFDGFLDKILDVAEFVDEHWTAVKWTFVGASGVIVTAIGAIGVAATANAVTTVVQTGKMIAGFLNVGKAATAAKSARAAFAAAETAASAGGAATTAASTAATGAAGAGAGAAGAGAAGAATGGGTLAAFGGVAGAASIGAAIAGLAAAGWQAYELWAENQDFDLFDVEMILDKLRADAGSIVDGVIGAVGQPVWDAGAEVVNFLTGGLASGAMTLLESAGSLATGVLDSLQATFAGGQETLSATCSSIGSGMANAMTGGLWSAAGSLISSAASLGQQAIQSLKNAIGWHSPPAAFVELGQGSAQAYLDALRGGLPQTLDMSLTGGIQPSNDVGLLSAQATAGQRFTGGATGVAQAGEPATTGIVGALNAIPGVEGALAASRAVFDAGRDLLGAIGLTSQSGPSAMTGGANDNWRAPSQPLPMAAGAEELSRVGVDQPQVGPLARQATAYGGGNQQIFQVSISVNVEGNATKEDADALAESIKSRLMPSVRAEIQKTLTNAGASAR